MIDSSKVEKVFCTTKAAQLGLENWQEEIGREEFALEAISVFGKLSILDEPLIIVFDQLEGLSNKPLLLSNFGSGVKEILTHVPNSLVILNLFPERWQEFQQFFDGSVVDRVSQYQVRLNRPSDGLIKEILKLKVSGMGLELEQLFSSQALQDILSQNSIRSVLNRAAAYYRQRVQGVALPPGSSTQISTAPGRTVEERLQRLEQEFASFRQGLRELVSSREINDNSQSKEKGRAWAKPEEAEVEGIVPLNNPEQIVKDYLQLKQCELSEEYEKPQVISDTDDIGKLSDILTTFQVFQPIELSQMSLGKRVLPEHINIKIGQWNYTIGFLNETGTAFTRRIQNFNELAHQHPNVNFRLMRDVREPEVKGAVGRREIEKLGYLKNGRYMLIEKEDRLNFELIYALIVDLRERNLEADLVTAFQVLIKQLKEYWLIKLLQPPQ